WDADYRSARPVLWGAPGDLSVSYNAHLHAFLAVHGEIFGRRMYFHTAPRPEGPWSAKKELFVSEAPAPGQGSNCCGKEHHELASDDGATIVVTYSRQTAPFRTEVRVVDVTLR